MVQETLWVTRLERFLDHSFAWLQQQMKAPESRKIQELSHRANVPYEALRTALRRR